MKLGKVTQTTPLRVELSGDTEDAPAEGPTSLPTDTEVLVVTHEGRRFVIYPSS